MHGRTRIKICGITQLNDALFAADAGADALGFVFVEASMRYLIPKQAAAISAKLPAFITRVGLFLDTPESVVRATLQNMPELVPQFHGNESAAYCESFDRPYIKAVGAAASVAGQMPDAAALGAFKSAVGFLYDSHVPGALGGTGKTFDWTHLAHDSDVPLILAGGLSVANVADAVRTVKPYAVDISSAVEQSKGIKDNNLVTQFIAAVIQADFAMNESL
ncbi:MAG: phosphoribosylanthranilate isomerase [Granulosicoccaceae bacterium]